MPLILPGNVGSATAATGFNVANSCRFDGSSSYLQKTYASGQNKTFSISTWIKRSSVGDAGAIWSGYHNATNYLTLAFLDDDTLRFQNVSAGVNMHFATNRIFKDVSAWMHILAIVDTTDGTAGDRQQIFINGVRETSFSTSTAYAEDDAAELGATDKENIVGRHGSGADYFDGYMAEHVFIDGLALAPTSFGEFDSDNGIWKPIDVSGLTFGTNGYYLDFEASGNLGNDANGGTDLTENGLAAVDQSTDTCTNNFATLNPLNNLGSNIAYSEGNLTITPGTSDYKTCISTIAVDSGKWYAEFKAVSGHNGSTDVSVGIIGADNHVASTGSKAMSAYLSSFGYGSGGLVKKYDNSTIRTDATYTDDNIIGIAVDMDNLKLYWSKDGAFQNSGDPTSGATGTGAVAITPAQLYYIAVATISSGGVKVFSANFGSPPYSESGGETDGDGYGNFAHAVPSGYFALNTKNLAEYGG